MMLGIFLGDAATYTTGEIVGGGGALVVVGGVIAYLMKYLPILNEEHKKYKNNVVDQWRGFAERQGTEIDMINKRSAERDLMYDLKFAQQEERYIKCQESNSRLMAEVESLKKDLARLEKTASNNPPILLTAAEIVFAPNGEIQYATEGVFPLIGYMPTDLIGQDVGHLLPQATRKAFFDRVTEVTIEPGCTEKTVIYCDALLHKNHREKIKCNFLIAKGMKRGVEVYMVTLTPLRDFFDT